MDLRMSQLRRIIVRCKVCKSDPHAEGCPVVRLEKLMELNRYIDCPACNARGVGVNPRDYYECRFCHEQFTTNAGFCRADDKFYYLDDPRASDLIPVKKLPNKGDGNFPIDKAIEEVRDTIKKLTAKKSKRSVKKRKK